MQVIHADLLDPAKMAVYQRGQTFFDLYANPFDADAHLRMRMILAVPGSTVKITPQTADNSKAMPSGTCPWAPK